MSKRQDEELVKILLEVYDKGFKGQDCDLTEYIKKIHLISDNMEIKTAYEYNKELLLLAKRMEEKAIDVEERIKAIQEYEDKYWSDESKITDEQIRENKLARELVVLELRINRLNQIKERDTEHIDTIKDLQEKNKELKSRNLWQRIFNY